MDGWPESARMRASFESICQKRSRSLGEGVNRSTVKKDSQTLGNFRRYFSNFFGGPVGIFSPPLQHQRFSS